MPSSISNSELRTTMKYIVVLLGMLCAGQMILQFGADWVMRRYGKNEIRWAEERKAAGDLVHDGKGVLLIGSSVLLGVDPAQLRQEVPDWTVRRAVMVGTFYTDWEYSIRRLLEEGVKPDYLVLTPLPFQIYGDSFRGDYLPLHWLSRRDIHDLARSKDLGLTAESNLYFASYDSFFALRDEVRNAILGNLIPGHKVLAAGTPNHRTYTDAEMTRIITDRLMTLQTLLADNGSRLVILHYPAPDSENGWKMVERITTEKNIPYFSAVDTMLKDRFVDAYHLDPQGTHEFTTALGPALTQELNRLRSQPHSSN